MNPARKPSVEIGRFPQMVFSTANRSKAVESSVQHVLGICQYVRHDVSLNFANKKTRKEIE